MKIIEALLTNGAFGYPTRGHVRRHTPHLLAIVHQTSTRPYDGQAMVLRNQRNGAGYVGNSADFYIDPDGDGVHAVDGSRFACWGAAPEKASHLDTSRPSIKVVAAHIAEGYNANECCWEQYEAVGQGSEPWTDAQFETVAQLIAARARICGLPVTRETIVPHRDLNTVNRPSDPWPVATREARMTRLVARVAELVAPATGGEMIVIDTTQPLDQLVDVATGVPLYESDGVTKVTEIYVGGGGLHSPFGINPNGTHYRGVEVTTGGRRALLFVKVAQTTNLRPLYVPTPPDVKHAVELRVDGAVKFAGEV